MLLFKRIVHSKSEFHPFQQQQQQQLQLLTHMPTEAVVTLSIFHPTEKETSNRWKTSNPYRLRGGVCAHSGYFG